MESRKAFYNLGYNIIAIRTLYKINFIIISLPVLFNLTKPKLKNLLS